MDKRQRILVVEDIGSFRESYVSNLMMENYRTDGAGSLATAIDALQACSYHAAVVDIMLGGEKNTSNRDGVKVLEYIRNLDDGTQPIVVSKQEDLQRVRDFLKEYGAFDYLDKKELRDHGISPLLTMIRKAVSASKLSAVRSWDEIVKPLSWKSTEARFVSECLRLLDFRGGFEHLSGTLSGVMQYLLPLLVVKDSEEGMRYRESLDAFSGQYWSKGQGKAVEILLFSTKRAELVNMRVSEIGEANVLETRERAGLSLVVLDHPGAQRATFIESQRPPSK